MVYVSCANKMLLIPVDNFPSIFFLILKIQQRRLDQVLSLHLILEIRRRKSSRKPFTFRINNFCVYSSFFLELSCDVNRLHFTTFEKAARTLKIRRCILYMKTGIKYLLEMKRKLKKNSNIVQSLA